MLKSALCLDKIQRLLLVRQSSGTTVPGNNQRAAGIAHPAALVPIPTLEVSVNESAGKSIASTHGVKDLNRETWGVDRRISPVKHRDSTWPPFQHQRIWPGGGGQLHPDKTFQMVDLSRR